MAWPAATGGASSRPGEDFGSWLRGRGRGGGGRDKKSPTLRVNKLKNKKKRDGDYLLLNELKCPTSHGAAALFINYRKGFILMGSKSHSSPAPAVRSVRDE